LVVLGDNRDLRLDPARKVIWTVGALVISAGYAIFAFTAYVAGRQSQCRSRQASLSTSSTCSRSRLSCSAMGATQPHE
jgi:hypothetical protein